ncbi:hypothetical protein [Haemophilus pittmaniae]|uniref:hypothetical protein n=1 Tax=Haemophilus pittmaniae TaxID=249188 RepID=UPI0028DC1B2B|nr:hypothetical protein [Haemophilus pittmaniae]
MKYIDKQIEDPRTGAITSYHAVSGLQTDYTYGNTHITIVSYVSADKKKKGKDSVSINTFTIQGVADWDAIPYEWALNQLVQPAPDGFVPDSDARYVNPYIFAGGKIKELAA